MSIRVSSLREAVRASYDRLNCDQLLSDGSECWSKFDLLAHLGKCPPGPYTVLDDGTILPPGSGEPLYTPACYEPSGSRLREMMRYAHMTHDALVRKTAAALGLSPDTARTIIDDVLHGRRDIRNVPFRFGLTLAGELNVSPFDLL